MWLHRLLLTTKFPHNLVTMSKYKVKKHVLPLNLDKSKIEITENNSLRKMGFDAANLSEPFETQRETRRYILLSTVR